MSETRLEELERVFKALANINRLKLIVALQTPRGYNEIDLAPSRGDSAGSVDRSISRQAVRGHIRELMDLGVVREVPTEGQGSEFIVDHARLFAVVEEMRHLATVQPALELHGETLTLDDENVVPKAAGPHLVLVRGVQEGRAFELGADQETWLVGRRSDCDVPLDYDAYVSREHARIVRRDQGFAIADLPSNKNGTRLNWRKLNTGAVAPLDPGDIIGVGRTLLVFRS